MEKKLRPKIQASVQKFQASKCDLTICFGKQTQKYKFKKPMQAYVLESGYCDRAEVKIH